MKILMIHSLMFHHRTWQRAADRLAEENIELCFAQQMSAPALLEENAGTAFDLIIAEIALGLPGSDELIRRSRPIANRLGLSAEIPSEFTTFSTMQSAEFKRYLAKVDLANFINSIRFLAAQTGLTIDYDPPGNVSINGIYHPKAPVNFEDLDAYRTWHGEYFKTPNAPLIGILFYYSQLVEGITEDIDALILALESCGLAPVCVFCAGAEDMDQDNDDGPVWLSSFNRKPKVEVVLNLLAGRLLKNYSQIDRLEDLDIPIIQLLRSHSQTPAQWLADPAGLPALTAVFSFAQPETFGVIAPMVVAGAKPAKPGEPVHGWRRYMPIKRRLETLCRRIQRWVHLRCLTNHEKRITIVLHNNPCKGVEATIGMAAGLDTFDSLALVLKQMKDAGYDVGNAPQTGRAIFEDIMSRKAVAEFRWTTVDEIVTKGGFLHLMDAEEYLPWFESISSTARQKVLKDWEEFPGQSMAYEHNGRPVLVITGVQYGNIRIMVQPKRGCYGPKCTGEVCRILHDPALSPPHHWLASYKYIQQNSDAVVHFGTEGALEYLPGKQSGLSDDCFPEISIGDLPNFYVYVMDVTGEGLIAKRRGQAVLVDHLTPVYRPTALDDKTSQLEDLIEQYQKARAMEEKGRCDLLEKEIGPLFKRCSLVKTIPDSGQFDQVLSIARRKLAKIQQSLMPEGLHLLSSPPDQEGVAKILATMLINPPPGLPDMNTISDWVKAPRLPAFNRASLAIKCLLEDVKLEEAPLVESHALSLFCKDVANRIEGCRVEIAQLLNGLCGRFIPPGLSGALSRGKIDALPTGRNFFATDVTALPTRAAWEMGCKLADKLLLKYWQEEGSFPESIGVNIWSGDAFKSDGELFSQILYLMGVKPVWDDQGKVRNTESIAIEELVIELSQGGVKQRPRVDVTIQTSGIMRDMVPNFCELLDRSVVMVSRLEESLELNFIRKHTLEQMDKLRQETGNKLKDNQIRRMATLRVFSSAPGTYGLGVGLALDASAWEDGKDLTEIYINWGGHAYGADQTDGTVEYGQKAMQLLADQLSRLDVTYMKQSSAEYDVLDCSCYAVSMGGMATAAKTVGHKTPKLYWADNTLAEDLEITHLNEELEKSAQVKLLNANWIKHMKKHGYQGAQNVSSRVNNLFKWSATSGQVDKQLFDNVVKTYILDEKNREWLRETNPYALEEITRRLLEAQSRGLWQADDDMLEEVRSAALAVEGDMEETMGDVKEEFQGSKVDVLRARDVEKWELEWRIGS